MGGGEGGRGVPPGTVYAHRNATCFSDPHSKSQTQCPVSLPDYNQSVVYFMSVRSKVMLDKQKFTLTSQEYYEQSG